MRKMIIQSVTQAATRVLPIGFEPMTFSSESSYSTLSKAEGLDQRRYAATIYCSLIKLLI